MSEVIPKCTARIVLATRLDTEPEVNPARFFMGWRPAGSKQRPNQPDCLGGCVQDPKDPVTKHETIEQGALREAYEESGWKLDAEKLKFLYAVSEYDAVMDKWYSRHYYLYIGDIAAETCVRTEHTATGLYTRAETRAIVSFPADQNALATFDSLSEIARETATDSIQQAA